MGKLAILKKVFDVVRLAVVKNPELEGCLKVVGLGEVVTDKDIIIVFEGDVLSENMPVKTIDPASGEEVDLVTGTYTLKTGEVIEVLDGVCTKITPVDAATPAAEAGATEAKKPETPAATPKQTIERHEVETHFKTMVAPFVDEITKLFDKNTALEQTIKTLTEEKTALQAEVTKLGAQDAGTPAKTTIELTETKVKLSKEEILERNRKKLEEIKNKN